MFEKKFSIPWNQCLDFGHEIVEKYRDYIESIYFTPPIEMKTVKFKEHFQELSKEEYVNQLASIHKNYPEIRLNLLFNKFCMVEELDDASIEYMVSVVRELDMVTDVTVANLLLAEEFMKQLPDIKLHLSVRMDIDTYEKVAYLNEKYPQKIYCINLGRDCVYQFNLLEKLKKRIPEIKYKIIVNEFCMYQCLDSNLHSLMKAHDSYHQISRFQCACFEQKNFWRFLTGQGILPQDLYLWNDVIDVFKVSGRWISTEQLMFIIDSYISGKKLTLDEIIHKIAQGGTRFKFNSDLCSKLNMSWMYPDGFTCKRISCNHKCLECKYCQEIAETIWRE